MRQVIIFGCLAAGCGGPEAAGAAGDVLLKVGIETAAVAARQAVAPPPTAMERLFRIEGRVLRVCPSAATPVPQAAVIARREGQPACEGATDAQGRFALECGATRTPGAGATFAVSSLGHGVSVEARPGEVAAVELRVSCAP